jgi:serine/threonine-protein kinase
MAEQRGSRVVWIRPDPWWSQAGYFALREALVELANLPSDHVEPSNYAGAFPEARAGLSAVFSEPRTEARPMGSQRPWAQTPPDMPAPSNHRLLVAEALRWALGQACAASQAGVVLVVDDLRFIDGASRNALADLVSDPPFESVTLVAAHDNLFDPQWDGAETLMLGGLPQDIVAEMLQDDPATQRLMNGAHDIPPLHVEQLVRFAAEGGTEAPSGLADLIALRIGRLPVDARHLLQAIAVVGDAAPAAHIVALIPELSDMGRHLQTLKRSGMIERDDDRSSVAHPLIRDVAMATTPLAVRRQLHARARHDCGVETLQIPLEAHAMHAYHAARPFDALLLLEQCAMRAGARDDIEGSIASLRRGLEVARQALTHGELDDPLDAVVMFSCKLGDALATAGHMTDATGVLEEALALVGPSAVQRPRILASLASASRAAGLDARAQSHLREALSLARQQSDPSLAHSLERMRESFQGARP